MRGKDSRSLAGEPEIFSVTLEQALALYAQPKQRGRRAAAGPLREIGTDPTTGRLIVVREGKFGAYVTDGETNASLKVGDVAETLSPERGAELLQARREYIAENGGPVAKKAARKSAATRTGSKGARRAKPDLKTKRTVAAGSSNAAKKASTKGTARTSPAKGAETPTVVTSESQILDPGH